MKHACPVCGYPALTDPPRSLSGGGSYEICPSCGFQFGVSDDDAGATPAGWRADWLKRGAPWSSSTPPPAGWDAHAQLRTLTGAASRTVVITGCTRGCGRALVAWFVEAGATVIGCGRSVSEVEALRAQYGPPHDFCAVDVSDESQVAMWSARVLAMENAPDLVINNAGVIAPNAPLWKTPAEEIARVLGVNVAGTAAVIRHFAPAMIARGRGVFVNFSSGWGRSTSPEVAIYCASKWAIEGLTRALAQELPAGLAAVSLNPGIINTQMLRSCFGGSAAEYPEPSEWAQAAGPFLLGLGAAQNGASLDVPAA